MEEQVGLLWHRLVTRLAEPRHPQAAVTLAEIAPRAGILFRALGGDGGLQVQAAEAVAHGARRRWLQRLAGSGRVAHLAWRDAEALRLPPRIDLFPERGLNRDLYLWLAALAAFSTSGGDWFRDSQARTREILDRFPGLAGRYRRLVAAHLAQRPDPAGLAADEGEQERVLRAALGDPGSQSRLPLASRPPAPVPLWLHPTPPTVPQAGAETGGDDPEAHGGASKDARQRRRRRARRAREPGKDRGLITIRMENILTLGDYQQLDRGSEEEEDLERAAQAADALDELSVARDGGRVASRLRLDLDLPGAAADDLVIGEGILTPEWDHRSRRLIPDHCRIVPMLARDAEPRPLPQELSPTARRLRAQFQILLPARTWRSAQPDGAEIDLDAYLRFRTDRAAGLHPEGERLYLDRVQGARDLACLLLADLSLSTDTWVDDERRVIDVIRESLYLFAEALAATGDRFAVYGFSSRRRDPVRVHRIKAFDEAYGDVIRGRIQAIRPGYYTRMGAAIRHAQGLLAEEPAGRRLLLLLSDGKPNDLDRYEGRYGIEDTRHAVAEARRAGVHPFCVTIDPEGGDYLPYLFGSQGYMVIRRPQELPRKLPGLYLRLTR